MTDVPYSAKAPDNQGRKAAKRSFSVVDHHWGYIIRGAEEARAGVALAQLAAIITGAAFLAAALGLWLVPSYLVGADNILMRGVASVFFTAAAVYLLWYASRGTVPEIHIDVKDGEVREVVCNRGGRPTILARHGFDTIGGVHLDRQTGRAGMATLVLRYRNTQHLMPIVTGPVDGLESLRDRLGRDTVLMPGI